jgi:hypothetical protein
MKSHISLAVPAFITFALAACSAEVGNPESTGSEPEAVSCSAVYGQCGGQGWTGATCCATGSTCTYNNAYYSQCLPGGSGSTSSAASGGSCPSGANDDQQRAAATAAFGIMKAAAQQCGGASAGPCWGTTILASQRYRVASTGSTIEFDPTDPQYAYVPQSAKAALAIAQLDSTVAQFLVGGLQWDQQNTNGKLFPVVEPIAALANFVYPGNSSPIVIQDPQAGNDRRTEVVTGSSWCNTEKVHFADHSSYEVNFAPFNTVSYTNFYGLPKPAYRGGNAWPSTPFNGSGGSGNPYLVVSVNGQTLNWNMSSWPVQNCPGDSSCNGTIDIDPIPYAQPGSYYDANGNIVGPQANPFSLVITSLYADPTHANQWATRTVAGVQQWGTFSAPISILGLTIYQYVKAM